MIDDVALRVFRGPVLGAGVGWNVRCVCVRGVWMQGYVRNLGIRKAFNNFAFCVDELKGVENASFSFLGKGFRSGWMGLSAHNRELSN